METHTVDGSEIRRENQMSDRSLWIQVPPEKIQIAPKLYPFRAFRAADPWIHRGVVYPIIYKGFIHHRWLFRISEPSTAGFYAIYHAI